MNSVLDKTLDILERYRSIKHGGNLAAMARELNIPTVTLSQWLKKTRTPNLAVLDSVFNAMGVQLVEPNEALSSYLFLTCGRARIAEDGSLQIAAAPHPPFAFESNWLVSLGISPASCFLMKVEEPSMFPVDAYTLINRDDTRLQNGHVYLVGLGKDLLLRRVFRTMQGVSLHADSGTDPDLPVKQDELPQLAVFGRVCWYCRTF